MPQFIGSVTEHVYNRTTLHHLLRTSCGSREVEHALEDLRMSRNDASMDLEGNDRVRSIRQENDISIAEPGISSFVKRHIYPSIHPVKLKYLESWCPNGVG